MADSNSIAFSCNCGQVQGHIAPATARSGTHAICHCRDCRAADLYLDQPDPNPAGVDLFLTTPDTVHVEAGADRLAVLRLGPKGPLRWYASCCKAPLFTTLPRPGIPFVSVRLERLQDSTPLGPVLAHSHVSQPDGTTKHKGAGVLAWRLLTRMGAARLSGRWRQTPFCDPQTGIPTAPVHILNKQERAALYP